MTPVAEETQGRGSTDTTALASAQGWRGARPREERRFWGILSASLIGHLLITPLPALLGLLTLLSPRDKVDEPPVDAIPVDLLEEGAIPEPPPPAPVPPSEAPAVAEKSPDAPAPASEKPKEPKPAAPPSEEKPKPSPAKTGIADPVEMAGLAGKAADSNANVRVLLHTGVIREHALGARVGGLLRRTPQWSDFFGPAGVDPIRDIDHVLIAGPQLRDSSNVVAVVQHRLAEAQVTAAFDRLVERGGEWIEQTPRMARAKADRAERIFVAPAPRIVAVVPPSAEKSARKLGKNLRFPAGDAGVAVSAYVVTPWRVAKGSGIVIPKSIAWAKFELRPDAKGGVTLEIEAEDESEEVAKENAALLGQALRAATEIDFSRMGLLGGAASAFFGSSKQKFVEKIDFDSKGKLIRGTIVVTAKQTAMLLDLLDGILPPEKKQKEKPRDDDAAPSGTSEGAEKTPSSTDDAAKPASPEAPAAPEEAAPSGDAPSGDDASGSEAPTGPSGE